MVGTHGSRGVAAAVECGMGGLPGAAAVDAGDPGMSGCEKAEDGCNAEEQLH